MAINAPDPTPSPRTPSRRTLLTACGLTAASGSLGARLGCGRPAVRPAGSTWSEQAAAIRSGDAAAYRSAVAASGGDTEAAAGVFAAIEELRPADYRIVTGRSIVETLVVGLGAGRSGDTVGWSFPVPVPGRKTPTASGPVAFWRTGSPTVRRRHRVLVVGPDPATVAAMTDAALAARSVIGRLWADPGIDPALVLVVAGSGARAAWGTGPGAVATTGYGPSADHPVGLPTTVVDPGLPVAGAAVLASVVRHEAVHALALESAAAGGATGDAAPAWLREGLAEYLSARSLRLGDRLEARACRRSGPGAGRGALQLPADADFGAAAPAVRQAAYDRSWLAVRAVVELVGLPATTRWYRSWSTGGSGTAPAGVPMRAVLERYRSALRHWRP